MIKLLSSLLCCALCVIAFLLGQRFADHGESQIAVLAAAKTAAEKETITCEQKLAAETEKGKRNWEDLSRENKRLTAELETAKAATPKAATVTAGDTTQTDTTATQATPATAGEPEEFLLGKLPDPTKCEVGAIYKIHRIDPGKKDEAYRVQVVACHTPDKEIPGMKGLKALMKELKIGGRSVATNICNGSAGHYDAGKPMFVCAMAAKKK